MRATLAVTALVGVLALGACGEDPTVPARKPSPSRQVETSPTPSASPSPSEGSVAEVGCSASELGGVSEQDGLPRPVAKMRSAIVDAAVACDYEQLEKLALEGQPMFTYSFGDDGAPAEYWRQAEKRGQTPLATLVQVLHLAYVEPAAKGGAYAWPSAFQDEPSDDDWQALIDAGLYTKTEIAQMKEFGGYIGYRVGITPEGDWIFFVAGD